MRKLMIGALLLLAPAVGVQAGVSLRIDAPHVRIGINVPAYPDLVQVPGYPVYYAPHMNLNYFFFDGDFWVFKDDDWYVSSWYDGPWSRVDPVEVPAFILRIPVGYYRHPPVYFRAWQPSRPPHWEHHWGHRWAERRPDWDRWNHRSAARPAPLPRYQREYSHDRYPHDIERQHAIREQHYSYRPRYRPGNRFARHDDRDEHADHWREDGRGHGRDHGLAQGDDRQGGRDKRRAGDRDHRDEAHERDGRR